jgi:hypothetical protein
MASRIADLVELIGEALDDPDVTLGVGRKAQRDLRSPPAVVFVPTLVPPVPVTEVGAHAVQAGQSPNVFRKRAILYTQQAFEVHVWGGGTTDEEQIERTEQLYHNVLNAIRATVRGSVNYAGGEWVSQQEAESAHIKLGEEIVFNATVVIPVIDENKKLTAATWAPVVGKLNGEVAHG